MRRIFCLFGLHRYFHDYSARAFDGLEVVMVMSCNVCGRKRFYEDIPTMQEEAKSDGD